MEDLTGKQLGPYQVVDPLGEGGMAAVYKAYQPSMERYVALKILFRHFASDPQFLGRFEQEAKMLAQLQHPHILPVFDFGETDGYTYIAMPLLQSGDLTDLLGKQTLTLQEIRRVITQVGDALDYAHQHGLVHRDVKPSNVLLDERGNCLLTDFGIAKIAESSASLTATGAFIGTPAYMSPEQGQGYKLDGRSDIYALGIMLYEMVIGRVPYRAETPMAVVVKHINDPLPPPRQLLPELPEAVEQVILKALAKRPDDRYATAGDMVRALQAAIPNALTDRPAAGDSEATLVSVPGPAVVVEEAQTVQAGPAREDPPLTLNWILSGVLVVLLTIGGIAFYNLRDPDPDPKALLQSASSQNGVAAGDLYDDFNDPNNDGEWDNNLWEVAFDDEENQDGIVIEQNNGTLMLSRRAADNNGLAAIDLGEFKLGDIAVIEARIKLDRQLEASQGDVGVVLAGEEDSELWWFGCNIGAGQGDDEAWAACDSIEDFDAGLPVEFDSWHTLRLEIEPETPLFTFFVDDEKIGQFTPADPDFVKDVEFVLLLMAYSEDGGVITGFIDDVYVGRQ